jgi:hypothetical protein
MYANKLKVDNDGNELTLVGLVKKVPAKAGDPKIIRYQYTKSAAKQGMFLDLTEKEYENYLKNGIFKGMEAAK